MSHRAYFRWSGFVGLILSILFSGVNAQVGPSKYPFLSSIQALPSLELITENSPSEGYIFLSAFNLGVSAEESHLLIIDNKGEVIQSKSLPFVAIDFHVQPDGTLSYFDSKKATYTILDSALNEIRDLPIGTYPFDNHELIVLPGGGYLFIGEDNYQDDLSKYADTGATDALVLGKVILEYDAQGNKIFQWRTRDHIPLTEATIQNLNNTTVNPYHFNSIEIDHDSNLIISARNLDQVFKIHRKTGEFMWRLGGKKNDFTLIGDSVFFSWQHCSRILPNGDLILFDNGTNNVVPFSRACEYSLDTVAKTATLVRQFRHTPDLLGRLMGSVQHLPNDNMLIG
ncbi:MAG TPA: aryl-sulfate sulfotransferase, partial [Candidatus Kapabacteria bacterium]